MLVTVTTCPALEADKPSIVLIAVVVDIATCSNVTVPANKAPSAVVTPIAVAEPETRPERALVPTGPVPLSEPLKNQVCNTLFPEASTVLK